MNLFSLYLPDWCYHQMCCPCNSNLSVTGKRLLYTCWIKSIQDEIDVRGPNCENTCLTMWWKWGKA